MTPDVVELRGLRLVGIVGVLPEERVRPQPLELDVDIETDLSSAGNSDDLAATVDYGAACDRVAATVAALQPLLLERLATQVVLALLELDDSIDAVTVSVRKLRPPVPHALMSGGVRIRRTRSALTSAADGGPG